jgi:hypothetical protein
MRSSELEFFFGDNVASGSLRWPSQYSLWMVFIAFICTKAHTELSSIPSSPISSEAPAVGRRAGGWITGIINGYLLAGTIWYYLAYANWPSRISEPFSSLYYAISAILPPVIFKWYYVVVLIVLLLIIKVSSEPGHRHSSQW